MSRLEPLPVLLLLLFLPLLPLLLMVVMTLVFRFLLLEPSLLSAVVVVAISCRFVNVASNKKTFSKVKKRKKKKKKHT